MGKRRLKRDRKMKPRETDYYCPLCHRFLTQKEVETEDGHERYCINPKKYREILENVRKGVV